MINFNELCITNYCHKNCTPLKNIMWLPKAEAFTLAQNLAQRNKDATAFYRFADFANYYPRRVITDEYLCAAFTKIGGKPRVAHPLSFVLQGSDYLDDWFGGSIVTKLALSSIEPEIISFTYGDSSATLERTGELTVLTKEMLLQSINKYEGALNEFLKYISAKYNYIEVQFVDEHIGGYTKTVYI